MRKRGTSKLYVYTVPSKKAIQAVKDKIAVKTYRATQNQDFAALLQSVNKTLAAGGRTTSGTACPKPSSARSTHTRGDASCAGCGASTKDAPGWECRSCGGASAPPAPGYSKSAGPGSPARQPCRLPATATAERGYLPRGHPIRRQPLAKPSGQGTRRARCAETRTSTSLGGQAGETHRE
jgi:hypothetical protein